MSRQSRLARHKKPTTAGQRYYVLERNTGKKIVVDNYTKKQYSNSVEYIRLTEPVPDGVKADPSPQTEAAPAAPAANPKKARKALTPEQKAARAEKAKQKRAEKKAAKK